MIMCEESVLIGMQSVPVNNIANPQKFYAISAKYCENLDLRMGRSLPFCWTLTIGQWPIEESKPKKAYGTQSMGF